MYGTLGGSNVAYQQQQYQPSEKEQKLQDLRNKLYSHIESFRFAEKFPALCDAGILTRDEARKILDIEGFIQLIEQAKELG